MAVGAEGVVCAQNPPMIFNFSSKRLALGWRPRTSSETRMTTVARWFSTRPFAAILPDVVADSEFERTPADLRIVHHDVQEDMY